MTDMRQRFWTKPFLVLVAVVVCGLMAFGVWLVTRDSRESLTIAAVAESAELVDGFASEALSGLKEDTGELCGGVSGCVEAYASPTVELLRFDSKDAASNFSSENLGSRRSDWIVIVYPDGRLSADDKAEVEDLIDSMWRSE